MLHKRGITVMIPQNSDQIAARNRRGRNGGRPSGLDAGACKGRNVAERSFALAKQWRALATRYDKLAITYRAAAVLSACLTWTRIQQSRPPARASRARDRPR
jgi:transposase